MPRNFLVCLTIVLVATIYLAPGVEVIWHSQPVKPGQTVLLYGGNFNEVIVEGVRLPDTPSITPPKKSLKPEMGETPKKLVLIQPRNHAVKAILPERSEAGVYALKVTSGSNTKYVLINKPKVWWARGGSNLDAYPGGTLRVFGLGLGWKGAREDLAGTPPGNPTTKVVLRSGVNDISLVVEKADLYSAQAQVPNTIEPGDYEVWVHNGCGGSSSWGRCEELIKVRNPVPWPSEEYNVFRFGARGDGKTDDTDAVQSAINAAGDAGGGIVTFPSGQYRFNKTIRLPKKVLLRGSGRENTLLYWSNPHFGRLRGIIHGTSNFGLEDFTIWYVGAERGIENMAEVEGERLYSTKNRPDHWKEGNIHLRRLVIRWSPYAARPGWGELPDTLQLTEQLNFRSLDAAGKGSTVWLCGRNIQIEDCDILSGGFPLLLAFMSDGSVVKNNILRTGRGGLVWAQRGRKCIWENNQMLGVDGMSRAGWSTKAHPYYDQIYFRNNTVAFAQSADYEIVGSDGASPVYYGNVLENDGLDLKLAKDVLRWDFPPEGHLAFVLGGSGKGQARTVIAANGRDIKLQRPWEIPLDETSILGINHSLKQWLIVGNRIADGDSMQMYGLNHEVVFAENQLERVGGSVEGALRFIGFQHTNDGAESAEPSFFSQMLGNEVVAPRMDMRRFASGTLTIELIGGSIHALGSSEAPCLMNAAVVRGNRIKGGRIRVSTDSQPKFRAEDILLEENFISDSPQGFDIGGKSAGIMLRNNTLQDVRIPLTGPGIKDAWLAKGVKRKYWWQSIEGALRRLSADKLLELGALRKLAESDLDQTVLQKQLAEIILSKVPPPHHPDLARSILEISVVSTGGSLESILNSGRGGKATFGFGITSETSPECEVRVDPIWPKDWEATTKDGMFYELSIPKSTWGRYSFPARVSVKCGEATFEWEEVFSAGQGSLQDWRILPPETLNGDNEAEFATRVPKQWNQWKSVQTSGPRIRLVDHVPSTEGNSRNNPQRAHVACAFHAKKEIWAEIVAASHTGGYLPELQIFLDGVELPDLRLGHETWSPKRLPISIKPGPHVIMITTRYDQRPPEFEISVHELGRRSGGNIRPILLR